MDDPLHVFRMPYFFENTQSINGIYDPFMFNLFLHEDSSSATLYTHLAITDFTDLYVILFDKIINQMCMTGKTCGSITSVIFRNVGITSSLWENPLMEVSSSKPQWIFYINSSYYDDLFEFLKRYGTKFK